MAPTSDQTPKKIRVQVNGRSLELDAGLSISDLLGDLNLAPEHVVVEMNAAIVEPEVQSETIIPEGAKIEIVRFVGGG